MEKPTNTLMYTLIFAVLVTGFILLDNTGNKGEIITGQFTEAGENKLEFDTKSDGVYVEKIYWNFGNKTIEGRLVKHNFSEGTHNITVKTVKSNGQNETHHAQIEIKRN